jgi:hypothetical protein
VGTHSLLLTVSDEHQDSLPASVAVTVVDRTPPDLAVSVSPSVLWPPDHTLRTVRVEVNAPDSCGSTQQVRLVSITSSEPDDAQRADGRTRGDIVGAQIGTDDREFQLRAERAGDGPGRVYTITYEAVDQAGNRTERSAQVFAPHH